MTTVSTHSIQIYVACMAAYNDGILHGQWIDARQEPHTMWEAVDAMLEASPIKDAAEYIIQDCEGFLGLGIGECESLENIAYKADFITQYGRLGAELANEFHGDVCEARSALVDHYVGQYESLAAFAQDITERTTTVPDGLKDYVDYEAMGRDFLARDAFAVQLAYNEIHVFWHQ